MLRLKSYIAFTFVFGVLAPAAVQAQFQHLTSRIPNDVNTIVLVDVDKLLESPLAAKEGWDANHQKAFESGMLMVPPDAGKFIKAAKMDFSTFAPIKELALMDLKYEPSVVKVAGRFRGSVDKIAGKDIAVLPGDMYMIKFGPTIAGVGWPARRQDVAGYINRVYSNTLGKSGFSSYLKEAIKFAEGGSPVIMAMDLSNMLSPAMVQSRLASFEAIKGKDIDLEAASKAIASIRGVSLGITVNESRYGAIKVDFSEDVSSIKDVAKEILLEVLSNQGVMIDEFENWDVKVGKNQIQIGGDLEQSGTRRIMSLLEMPPTLKQADQGDPADNPEAQEQMVIRASQLYLKSVTSMIDCLRRDKSNRKTMGQISVFMGKYARKIDRLPMLNVDPQLLEYGKFVADSLRDGQQGVTTAAARSRVRQQEVPEQYDVQTSYNPIGVVGNRWYGGGGVYGWSGWSATHNRNRTGQLQSHVRTQERIRGNMSANLVMQGIDEATADIRRIMTQKYSADF